MMAIKQDMGMPYDFVMFLSILYLLNGALRLLSSIPFFLSLAEHTHYLPY